MSCFSELTYAFFVDGELDASEARSVEAHLIGCRSCRALVVGLQDETTLLADVLHERMPQSYRLAPRAAPPTSRWCPTPPASSTPRTTKAT